MTNKELNYQNDTYTDWEQDVTRELEDQAQVTTSDAQGIIECQEFLMSKCWNADLSAEQTASVINDASTVRKPVKDEAERTAMGIVNQLFDLIELPVEKRQCMNDAATNYVAKVLREEKINTDRLWDNYSEHMGTDIDSLSDYAGQSIITKQSFYKLIQTEFATK